MTRFAMRKTKSRAMATNPVSRAIAWQRLLADLTEAKAALWGFTEGQPCEDFMRGICNFLVSALIAGEDSKMMADAAHPEYKTWMLAADQGIVAVTQLHAEGWRWKASNVVVFDDALDACALITKHCRPESINMAAKEWRRMVDSASFILPRHHASPGLPFRFEPFPFDKLD